MEASIGIDLGGSHILCILMDRSGSIICSFHGKIVEEMRSNKEAIFAMISESIANLLKSYHESEDMVDVNILGIGMSIPGNVDSKLGHTRYLPNFQWLDPVDMYAEVTPLLEKNPFLCNHYGGFLLNLQAIKKFHLRNDGRCAALAERNWGIGRHMSEQGQDVSVFAMITLGTGIGGALIYDEKDGNPSLFDGCSSDAGDFGHHVIKTGSDAFQCVCGKKGCFETHASAAGLVRHYYRHLQGTVTDISLNEAIKVVNLVFEQNDPLALMAWQSYLEDLTTGLANIVTFYNPAVIVLGGGLAKFAKLYQPQQTVELTCINPSPSATDNSDLLIIEKGCTIQQVMDAKTLPATRGKTVVIQSALDNQAGAMGAALLSFMAKES